MTSYMICFDLLTLYNFSGSKLVILNYLVSVAWVKSRTSLNKNSTLKLPIVIEIHQALHNKSN